MTDDFKQQSMTDFSLEELLELNDITEDECILYLYEKGFIVHPLGDNHEEETEGEEPHRT